MKEQRAKEQRAKEPRVKEQRVEEQRAKKRITNPVNFIFCLLFLRIDGFSPIVIYIYLSIT